MTELRFERRKVRGGHQFVLQCRESSYSIWGDVPVIDAPSWKAEQPIEGQTYEGVIGDETTPAPPARTCKRSACQTTKSDVWWWNQSTLAWYCRDCARKINDKDTGGTPYLCIPDYHLPMKSDLP